MTDKQIKEEINKTIEQEMEKLRNIAKQQIGKLEAKLKAKEQECKELKRQRQADKGLITSTGKMNYQLLQEYDKLKTALTEIKEIAETAAKCMYATYSDDYTEGYRWLGSIILQKISECEVK